ncbi:MAG: peptidoglycan editing factor PgeF [Planctomycetes bacterium]|nr:peptidoglycan editing factor PgeF [Planctomycetota bacterium]
MTLRLKGVVLVTESLSRFPEVGHAFTTRLGGVSQGPYASLNLAHRPDESPEHVARNRQIAGAAAGAPVERLATCNQVLGAAVVPAELEQKPDADALITDRPGISLLTFSADCCLALLYDPRRRAIANVHASRQGTRGEIGRKTVEAMTARFGTDPSELTAVIGPSIGPCCYELREETLADWRAWAPEVLDGPRLDLKAALRGQLTAAGVAPGSIETSNLCTRCRAEWFYSYRRDGERTGRFGAMIWMR